MSIFARNVAGIILVIGLFAAVGCSTTQSDKKMNIFSLQRVEKEPDKPTSVGEFIGRDRVTTL